MFFMNLRKQMKWVLIALVAMFGGSLFYIGGPAPAGEQEVFAQTVAEVDGEVISAAELQSVYRNNIALYRQFFGQIQPGQNEEIMYRSLDSLIRNRLLLTAARAEGVPVDRAAVDEEFEQIKANFPSDRVFREQLRNAGLTERSLRTLIEEHLMVQQLEESIRSQIDVISEDDIKASYESVRARHILISPPVDEAASEDEAWEQALAKALELRDELLAGADFAQLAEMHSDDRASAVDGGDVGMFQRSSPFVQEFKDAAFALDVGEVSEPVRSTFGYHLIEVTERRGADDEGFEEARADIEARLREERGEARFQAWLEERRAEADIVIYDARLRAYEKMLQEDFEGALAEYRLALEEDPFDPYLHVSTGAVLQQLDRVDEALLEFEAAVDKSVGDPDLQLILGLAYWEAGRAEDAARVLVEASEAADWDPNVQFTAAHVLRELGYEDEAEAADARLEEIMQAWAEEQEEGGDIEFLDADWLDGAEMPEDDPETWETDDSED